MADDGTFKHQYQKWKQTIPFLYDWFANHNLTWPSLSCRWGPVTEESTFKRKHCLYLSERTDGSDPNKLMMVPVEVCKARVAAAESIAGFHEGHKSPHVKAPLKTILHPGEVNKIRELPSHPSIVVTHTDAKEVYVWDFDKQPHRGTEKVSDWDKLSVADLVLTGHTDNAEFALSISAAQPFVASGGKDTNVVLWNLEDYDNASLLQSKATASPSASPTLAARSTLKGHSDVVEDISFQPGSSTELASVGDDYNLIFWDTRAGSAPILRVADAHGASDLHCLDWSGLDSNLVATGAADGSLRVWDRRSTAKPTFVLEVHTRPIMRVEWASYKPGVLASGGEDGIVCVWDLERKSAPTAPGEGPAAEGTKARSSIPAELLFQHAGHRAGIADFQWHPSDPYTMISVSDDNEGGTLQLWRINDIIYRPEAEVLRELEQFRDEILPKEGSQAPQAPPAAALNKSAPQAAAAATPIVPAAAPGSAANGAIKPETSGGAGPVATGGSASALTPAQAFVGVPEGVPVSPTAKSDSKTEAKDEAQPMEAE